MTCVDKKNSYHFPADFKPNTLKHNSSNNSINAKHLVPSFKKKKSVSNKKSGFASPYNQKSNSNANRQ
jgi:hypothetical protein